MVENERLIIPEMMTSHVCGLYCWCNWINLL